MTKNGHTHEAVKVATGEISQAEFANRLKLNPSTVSRNMATYYRDALQSLATERNELQRKCNALQSECNDVQRDRNEWQRRCNYMESECNELKEERNDYEARCNALQPKYDELQRRYNELQSDFNKWQGQPGIIKALASSQASTAMLFLLAAFEGVGSFRLLEYKGVALALPVSIAIAFALLHFTARQNTFGKWFCILFALAVGGIYFDVFPRTVSAYLFAFVPPIIAALIAFSFNLKSKKNG